MTRQGFALPVAAFVAAGFAPVAVMAAISFYRLSGYEMIPAFDLTAWTKILTSSLIWDLVGRSVLFGLGTALLTPLAAYPIALAMARLPIRWKGIGVILLLTPLYTGEIVRIYAWRILLGVHGLINSVLLGLGLTDAPVQDLLYTRLSAFIVMFYNNLPFMVICIWVAAETVDFRLIEAARDLGARPLRVFRKITFPLTAKGLMAGLVVVFALAAGDAMTPALMAGTDSATALSMIDSFFGDIFDWPRASALALLLVAAMLTTVSALIGAVLLILHRQRSAP